jgi:hypothetical protein
LVGHAKIVIHLKDEAIITKYSATEEISSKYRAEKQAIIEPTNMLSKEKAKTCAPVCLHARVEGSTEI